MFPVWLASDTLPTKQQVLGVLINGRPKAYALPDLLEHPVVNDSLGGRSIVVVTHPDEGGARVYDRGAVEFLESPELASGEMRLTDSEGRVWRVGEEALERLDGPSMRLVRVPTHMAFWFGWYASYPETQVFLR